MNKEERIKSKKAELMEIFEGLTENELKVACDLIGQAAFMAVTLEDLAESISENGTIEEYTNGANQSGRKISSDAKLYSALIAKYTAIVSKLLKLIPKEEDNTDPILEEHRANAEERAEDHNRTREMENAFFRALGNGEITQDQYKEFCEEWRRNNG